MAEDEILKVILYLYGECPNMVNIHITLERNQYTAGETAKGTLVISQEEAYNFVV
jgi:hypothetical protein